MQDPDGARGGIPIRGHSLNLPLHWRMELPQIDRRFTLRALHEEQWMKVDFPYWEGVVIISGTGPGNSGRGYMELTGYTAGQ